MTLQYDPYQLSEALSRMVVDLATSDTSGITSIEVSAALMQASQMIEELADMVSHYRTRNRVVVVANGEEIEREEDLVEPLLGEAIKHIVIEAIEMYLTASRVL